MWYRSKPNHYVISETKTDVLQISYIKYRLIFLEAKYKTTNKIWWLWVVKPKLFEKYKTTKKSNMYRENINLFLGDTNFF